jgi:lycopene beta-cyclase
VIRYDYIIAGAGCAGRSLAVRLSKVFVDKNILLVDSNKKTANDRTWCFWEKEPDIFEEIVSCRWNELLFNGSYGSRLLDIHPYQYKLIRAIDFYDYTNKIIGESNITVIHGTAENICNGEGYASIMIDGVQFGADYIFSSIPYELPANSHRYTYLLQHFKGWVIETAEAIFDKATLMDFSADSRTEFFYILPYHSKKALVEYTIFSDMVLSNEQYENALSDYIETKLGCKKYSITEVENGCIPMFDRPFKKTDKRIIYIGVAGGNAKASSGYAFRYIQHYTQLITALLQKGQYPAPASYSRFQLYDSIFLRLLADEKLSGKDIFSRLFEKNKAGKILKFLDNETTLLEEAAIFSTLQKRVFATQALKTIASRI